MTQLAMRSADDIRQVEEVPVSERWTAKTAYQLLCQTASDLPQRPAVSFQIKSGPKDKAETLTWSTFCGRVTQAANLFRSLGVGENDVVAYLLPNTNETAVALLGGATAGIVNPVNPLLDAAQIGAILRETGAKVLVTLAPFPKTDIAEKAAKACEIARNVEVILEVDLKRYLSPPLSWIVPLIRPSRTSGHGAKVLNFNTEMAKQRADALAFDEPDDPDRVCAYFHTGGTTGSPKVAQHTARGMLYNGWLGKALIFSRDDVLICPLPLFHVFAAYPILMCCVASGAHMVMPTPAGYRGDGVFDNFWKLIERWGVTFLITVPTAAAALMQRPVNADVSTLRYAICGSAPLPRETFQKFERDTGVTILEGYGMTEATCLVSCNPPQGERKLGSVGLPLPYTEIRLLHCDGEGNVMSEAGPEEVGEICIRSPGVFPGYCEEARNKGLFTPDGFLRSGDLGRLDADGYLWITGRAKDLIIRGGHNIDPAVIEEALAAHPDVAFVGAIGQPDNHSGEVPCAYVELVGGATVTGPELMSFAAEKVSERAAHPKYVEVLDELPKTAVGKVFKPDLRKMAITRIYTSALAEEGIEAEVSVVEDKRLGLVAEVKSDAEDAAIDDVLAEFARPWRRPG